MGVNTDSKLTTAVPEEEKYSGVCEKVDTTTMHDILVESRVLKTPEELVVMRWASWITSEAHCTVMQKIRPGQRESQLESFFNYDCQQKYFCGRVAPYTSICGCGPGAATLHYHHNDKWMKDGEVVLTDQGH